MSLLSEVVGVGGVLVMRQNVLALNLALLRFVVQEHLVDFLDVVLGESRADSAVVLHVQFLVRLRRRCGGC